MKKVWLLIVIALSAKALAWAQLGWQVSAFCWCSVWQLVQAILTKSVWAEYPFWRGCSFSCNCYTSKCSSQQLFFIVLIFAYIDILMTSFITVILAAAIGI